MVNVSGSTSPLLADAPISFLAPSNALSFMLVKAVFVIPVIVSSDVQPLNAYARMVFKYMASFK